ncbi:MAG: ABC transporter ATP-binding protein [Thermoprotei archaeon]
MSSEDAIVVGDLYHTYDGKKYVLSDVSFSVRKGEVFGLLGRNGAGKTTLIKILTTLIRPTSGHIRILGLDPYTHGPEVRRRIGVVQQDDSYDYSSVEGNLDIYGMLWGVSRNERLKRREELLELFSLGDVRKKSVFDLSGGQRRRLQVAREFMHDMEILFLDEPTVGLDVIMRRTLLDRIKELAKAGLTVVFTTHNLEEADYICDRIAVIDSGKILALDSVENLKRIYGKKTVEFVLGGGSRERFLSEVRFRVPNVDLREDDSKVKIVCTDPSLVLNVITDASRVTGVGIEWLNVRGSTLEDVFLETIGRDNG